MLASALQSGARVARERSRKHSAARFYQARAAVGTCSGTAPAYQWRKNGTNIQGASSASYTTPATTAADSGARYSFTCSNAAGTATSSDAILTVNAGGGSGSAYTVRLEFESASSTGCGGTKFGGSWVAFCGPGSQTTWNNVNIPSSGVATLRLHMASNHHPRIELRDASNNVLAVVADGHTGSWAPNGRTFTVATSASLPAGSQTLKLYRSSDADLDWLEIVR